MGVKLGSKAYESGFRRTIEHLDDQEEEENSEPQPTLKALQFRYYLSTEKVLEKELACSSLTLY